MTRYIILAQSEVTAKALNAWLQLLGHPGLYENDSGWIVWSQAVGMGLAAVEAYETLIKRVSSATQDEAGLLLNTVVGLVDAVRPAKLNAIDEGGWDNLVAMLILTFPEIYWIFGITFGTKEGWDNIQTHHNFGALLTSARRDPLFDPTGLRDWVRSNSHTTEEERQAIKNLGIPRRTRCAAAIDEERSYAYLHGYAAYRFGCRVDVVTTWAFMQQQFGPAAVSQATTRELSNADEPHHYWLLLEDMSLNFPDRPSREHLLRLNERATRCRKLDSTNGQLEKSTYRILVTTGQTRPGDNAVAENRHYLRNKVFGKGKIVFKPASGMFDLWAKSGLLHQCENGQRVGNVLGFQWPPSFFGVVDEPEGHGAPGKLMLIADTLMQRARALMDRADNIRIAVQGAVLATDALELTGGRTPTTAFDALSLKHRFEMLAECQFSGVEYHIHITPRIAEIALETSAIARWFHREQQTTAKLNAEMSMLSELVGILENHGQFDEMQICMNKVRHLHNTLWMRRRPLNRLLWPVLRYLELLLSSFAAFLTVLLVWVVGLSLLFWWTGPNYEQWWPGITDAVSGFFSVGAPIPNPDSTSTANGMANNANWYYAVVGCVAIVSGFVHLGVFISHLYSIISRR
jgi:hypothetical protein